MKKVKITICGGLGKMGKILIKEVLKNKHLILNTVTDVKIKKISNNIQTQKNSFDAFKRTDVIIDFSRPKSSLEILKYASHLKKRIVIGTTGFTEKQNNLIKKFSKKIAIFKSGNMSLGINLIEYIAKILSNKIQNNYQVAIEDNHHKKKIDYPSGTALMLANAIAKGKNKKLASITGKFFLNKKGNLNKNKVNFFITRKGDTIGKHNILFSNKNESIELKHTAYSRELFANGALNAAIWISKKNKGLFNMQDMFRLK
jgi:4-hydroxy-tetrahydrodipicolinate reductase